MKYASVADAYGATLSDLSICEFHRPILSILRDFLHRRGYSVFVSAWSDSSSYSRSMEFEGASKYSNYHLTHLVSLRVRNNFSANSPLLPSVFDPLDRMSCIAFERLVATFMWSWWCVAFVYMLNIRIMKDLKTGAR
ncbi:hypothetical protein PRIPAC_76230 [Pristionchus pacificus]|uniref:Uncharacterized protein n=1 Tax=Pristionchus pacificus TaxID=54126 RepID=A0A2A6C1E1_PRIPA|nr:hypothetical protein PRIPAC_76230 [Pristionchus pacificus]|eukprot:PDM71851.1 hypothetical protein PRIPAC_38258 [Pristionchus pacificus]